MSKVVFGVWDGMLTDNRGKRPFEIDELPEFDPFDEFDPGNPIKAFFGWKGFFVFDKSVNLLDAARQYIGRAAKESCGSCTPCRVGTQILKKKFMEIGTGKAGLDSLEEIEKLARHVKNTSLCGLGQTCTVPILEMIKYFKEEIVLQIEEENKTHFRKQPATTYVTAPCIEACPARVNVPKYIEYIKDGRFTHSIGVVLQKYPMAATCGRVCVRFCEFACRRTMVDEAVGIKLLKRFVADKERYVSDSWFTKELILDKKPDELKIAVIGGGPAGISAAYHLLLKGYTVDVFEAMTEPGGMAAVGIPEYRLPKEEILRKEVSIIESLGGRIFYNQRMGVDFTLDNLFERGYKSVFLGVGAHKGKTMGIPGEHRSQKGYKTGISFLLYINHYYINMGLHVDLGKKLVVVGGGNVAMDCARSALRLGVEEVHLVYRRTKAEMPADHVEVEAAEEEGVIFHYLSHPTKVITDGNGIVGIRLIKMELGEPDETGRSRVHPVDGSEYDLDVDFIVPAIGQGVESGFLKPEDNITLNDWGLIEINPFSMSTARKGVFAGGDCTTGPATLIEAMANGMKGAEAIDDYLSYGRVRFNSDRRMSEILSQLCRIDRESLKIPVREERRVICEELDPEVRERIFEEVEKPITVDQAYKEADRCLRCYRIAMVITEK